MVIDRLHRSIDPPLPDLCGGSLPSMACCKLKVTRFERHRMLSETIAL
jgi:hypothetical protein